MRARVLLLRLGLRRIKPCKQCLTLAHLVRVRVRVRVRIRARGSGSGLGLGLGLGLRLGLRLGLGLGSGLRCGLGIGLAHQIRALSLLDDDARGKPGRLRLETHALRCPQLARRRQPRAECLRLRLEPQSV